MVHLLSLKEAGPNLLKISESAFATGIATGLLSMVRDYEGRGAGAAAKKPTKSYDRVWAGIW